MNCPFCKAENTRVVDSREVDDGQSIRRRRNCGNCNRRFSTLESTILNVVKRSGVTEPFDRAKVINGVAKAFQGREYSDASLQKLAKDVEDAIRSNGISEIHSDEIGLEILKPLANLDEVAYLRFASVYYSYETLEDFMEAIKKLRN